MISGKSFLLICEIKGRTRWSTRSLIALRHLCFAPLSHVSFICSFIEQILIECARHCSRYLEYTCQQNKDAYPHGTHACVCVCVFDDSCEYILNYNKEKRQELPSCIVFHAKKLLGVRAQWYYAGTLLSPIELRTYNIYVNRWTGSRIKESALGLSVGLACAPDTCFKIDCTLGKRLDPLRNPLHIVMASAQILSRPGCHSQDTEKFSFREWLSLDFVVIF